MNTVFILTRRGLMIVSASNFPDTQSYVFLESLNLHTVRSTHAEESLRSSHAVLDSTAGSDCSPLVEGEVVIISSS